MNSTRKLGPVAIALYLNAALLLAILVVLLGKSSGASSLAFGDSFSPQQLPIAGGDGIYVMPCQFHPSVWGCIVMNTRSHTLCTYEYRSGVQSLVLTAARDFEYDTQLKNFNTDMPWYEVKKLVSQQNTAGIGSSADTRPDSDK